MTLCNRPDPAQHQPRRHGRVQPRVHDHAAGVIPRRPVRISQGGQAEGVLSSRVSPDARDEMSALGARSFHGARGTWPARTSIPYLSDEVAVGEPAGGVRASDGSERGARPPQANGAATRPRTSADRRRCESWPWSAATGWPPPELGGGPEEHYVRQPETGRVVRLNASAMAMLQELDQRHRAPRRWSAWPTRWAGVERSRLEADVLATGRSLVHQGRARAPPSPRSPPDGVERSRPGWSPGRAGADASTSQALRPAWW